MQSRTDRISAPWRLLALCCVLALAACSTAPQRGAYPTVGVAIPPVLRSPPPDSPVKIGKPYQIAGIWYYPADEANYDEVGYASWYGEAFHGGPTANGETFDMAMVGAAHKTLPLPCYVEVTALDTGRTIVVRINDRGPYVTNRIIDLSHRSAELLGIDRQGVARVRVRRVYPSDADRLALRSGKAAEERPVAQREALAALDARFQRWMVAQAQAAAAAAAAAAATTPVAVTAAPALPGSLLDANVIGGWFVQVGAYGDRARADSLASMLGGAIDAAGNVYRVRIGPYFDEQIALAALARTQGQGYQDARLIKPRSSN